MELGIIGRRALVTGGSSGLGLATARALAADGVNVVLASRSAEKLALAKESITPAHGASVHCVVADVSNLAQVTSLIEQTNNLLGGIDILIANAGGHPPGTFASTPIEAYDVAIRLNLVSSVAMCQAVVPAMQQQKW